MSQVTCTRCGWTILSDEAAEYNGLCQECHEHPEAEDVDDSDDGKHDE